MSYSKHNKNVQIFVQFRKNFEFFAKSVQIFVQVNSSSDFRSGNDWFKIQIVFVKIQNLNLFR